MGGIRRVQGCTLLWEVVVKVSSGMYMFFLFVYFCRSFFLLYKYVRIMTAIPLTLK